LVSRSSIPGPTLGIKIKYSRAHTGYQDEVFQITTLGIKIKYSRLP